MSHIAKRNLTFWDTLSTLHLASWLTKKMFVASFRAWWNGIGTVETHFNIAEDCNQMELTFGNGTSVVVSIRKPSHTTEAIE